MTELATPYPAETAELIAAASPEETGYDDAAEAEEPPENDRRDVLGTQAVNVAFNALISREYAGLPADLPDTYPSEEELAKRRGEQEQQDDPDTASSLSGIVEIVAGDPEEEVPEPAREPQRYDDGDTELPTDIGDHGVQEINNAGPDDGEEDGGLGPWGTSGEVGASGGDRDVDQDGQTN